MDAPDGIDPVHALQVEVHQHDVGQGLPGDLDGFSAVGGLSHDLELGCGAEIRHQAVPEHLVVLDQQHSDRRRGRRLHQPDSSPGPSSAAAGTRNSTSHPRSGAETNRNVPPMDSTGFFIEFAMPNPPLPSS